MSPGIFFVITAPTGAGKTTVAKKLLQKIPHLNRLVTVTTRPQRPAERNAIDYHFVTPELFEKMVNENAFIETTCYAGFRYGSPKSALEDVKNGKNILAVMDRPGAEAVKRLIPEDSVLIWLTAPTAQVCAKRLINRNSESPEKLAERITMAEQEMNEEREHPLCEVTFINDDLETCVQEIAQFIEHKKGQR